MKFKVREDMFVAACEYSQKDSCIYYQVFILMHENGRDIAFYQPFINDIRKIENVRFESKEELSNFMHEYIKKRCDSFFDGKFRTYNWKNERVAVDLYSENEYSHYILMNGVKKGTACIRFIEGDNKWIGEIINTDKWIDVYGEVIKEGE